MKLFLKNALKIVVYFHAVILTALLLAHCSFSNFAKKSYEQAKKERPYDVVIVPGVPFEKKTPNNVMKMRVFWAKHLYDSGYTKNVIFSGSSVYSPYVEGIVMKIMADSLGIPTDHTFSETKAEHSTENVYYSWKMARSMGFQKIALATDPYQAGLLRRFIKKYCRGMESVPIVFGTMNIDSEVLPAIDSNPAFVKNFVSIVDRQGFWERLSYTQGKRIKEEIEAEEGNKKQRKGAKD